MANFFVDKSMIEGNSARITGEEAGHISRVLRMKAGDALTLCDGEGMFYDAVISETDGNTVAAEIEKSYPAPTEPKLKITLFQGIPKNPKLEFIVQKATEIGVVKIVPMNTARIVARLDKESKIQRLQKIALEAAKQSKRGIAPTVENPVSFETAVEMAS
ncbi:MAG: RsmE family RNA methyltransferase, partial [Clostridia bacterium]